MIITRRLLLGSLAASFALRGAAFAQNVQMLAARRERRKILPDLPENDFEMFNGSLPGPLLRIKLGEDVKLRLSNETETPLALHWRGLRLPNGMDGVPELTQKPLQNGGTFDLSFTPPDAGTFLYHPSVRTHAARQMADGMAGLLVVEERDPPQVDADVAILLSEFAHHDTSSIILANGAREMETVAMQPGARIRLRVASASTKRVMAIGIDGARAQVAAIDGQPCGLFEPVRQTLPLVPGGRYDLFFDLPDRPGEDVQLVLRGMSGATDMRQTLARWRTQGTARAPLPAFTGLPDNPRLPARIPLQKARRTELVIEGTTGGRWQINGQAADEIGPKPFLSVRRGTAVTLGFVNRSQVAQLVHVHGHALRHMHLLDDGWEPYWRDSVVVPEGRTLRVAFVADNPGKWLVAGGFGSGEGPVCWFEVT